MPPVLSTAGDDGYTYAFVMEKQYTLGSLPTPNDERITLREVPARTVAAHRFSGRWTDGNYDKHEALLMAALERDGFVEVFRTDDSQLGVKSFLEHGPGKAEFTGA